MTLTTRTKKTVKPATATFKEGATLGEVFTVIAVIHKQAKAKAAGKLRAPVKTKSKSGPVC